MSKQKIIRGGLLIIMMILCLGMVSAGVEVWYDLFDNNDYASEGWTCNQGTCIEGSTAYGSMIYGVAEIVRFESQNFTNYNLSQFNLTFNIQERGTTSTNQKIRVFSNVSNIDFYFQESTNKLFVQGGTCGFASSIETTVVFPSQLSDLTFHINTTNVNQMYIYLDGVFKKALSLNSCFPSGAVFEKVEFIVDSQELVVNEFRVADYQVTECTDSIDNDGDGLTDANDPDCLLGTTENVYNVDDGFVWREDFTTTSSDCSYYNITTSNGIYTPNSYSCSVSSGTMKIADVNKYINIPFQESITSTARTTANYTVSLRMKFSSVGDESSLFYFRDLPSTASSLETLSSGQSGDLLQPTSYNLSDNLDTWIDVDFFHNESDNKVYTYVNGIFDTSSLIENPFTIIGISDFTLRNDFSSGGTLLTAMQVQIDSMSFSWGDTTNATAVTGCTDSIDNDGDTWIDANDPDCVTGNEEINIDLYPVNIYTNVTIFEDHFDNGNYSSEGWIDNTGGCLEGIGQSGRTVLYSNGIDECQLNRNLTIGDTNNHQYVYLDYFPFNYKNTSHFHIGNDINNSLTFEISDPDIFSLDGQVLYLPFDTDFLDASGLGNDGTIIGNTFIDTFGYENNSVAFDGNNDYVSISDSSSLDITQNISIFSDFYLSSYNGGSMVYSKGTVPYEYALFVNSTGGTVFYFNGNTYNVGINIDLEKWYRFSVTRDFSTGNLSFDVNGTLYNSYIDSGLIPDQSGSLIIGESGTYDVDGWVDEFRIYNRSLPRDEVQDYNDIEFLVVKGYGTCELPEPLSYSAETHLVNNQSYPFELIVDQDAGTSAFYLSSGRVDLINDSDCFDWDDEIYVGFRIAQPVVEIDLFKVVNINSQYSCYDGIDNDNDGFTDYPDDLDCTSPTDTEGTINYWECNDGIDNDNDGYIDYGSDTGCSQAYDNDELPKQGTACQDNECNEAQGCILDHSFECATTILNYGFTTVPLWYGEFVDGEIYNSRSVIGLHEFLGYGIITDSGVEQADTVTYFKEYSSNSKDYELIDNKFDLFFDYQYEESGITVQNISNEYITLRFFNSDYTIINKLFEVVIKPLSLDNQVWAKVYTVDEFGFEYLVGTMRTQDTADFGRVEFHVEIDTTEQNYRIYWTDALGESERTEPVDFDVFTYNYPDRFSMEVGGDPMYYSSSLKAESKMYLNNIKVYGTQSDTTTICTEWEKPYYFYEEFNGYMENCDWSVDPENIYQNGRLYISEDLEIFNADKDFSGIYEDNSRYATLDLTAIAYSYIDGNGYTLIQMMNDDYDPVFAIYLSENDAGDSGILGYYSDGDFVELTEFNYTESQRIYVVYDFKTDTFEILHKGQYTTTQSIGSLLPIVNPSINPTEISNFKIFSYGATYSLDSVKFYTSDSEGHLISITKDTPTQVFDEYPDMAGDSMCGYIDSQADTKLCSQDEECATGHCNKAEGTCSGFDYTYCDENGHVRGNKCIVSAIASCGLESAGDLLLDNFFLVLVALAMLMFFAYFIFIFNFK